MATKNEIKKTQCLLFYLGYYVGDVDGIWGHMSKTATQAFQKDFGGLPTNGVADDATVKAMKHAVSYGMPAKKQEAAASPVSKDFWKDIKYFKKSEFACKCGCGADSMDEKLIRIADNLRGHFNSPVIVTSGRRCAKHNAKVGGVANSRHLSGKAMDFSVSGFSASSVLNYVQKQPGIRYAYAIDNKHVHMDVE